jgi:hypothetical protein
MVVDGGYELWWMMVDLFYGGICLSIQLFGLRQNESIIANHFEGKPYFKD